MFKQDIKYLSFEGSTIKELWNNHLAKYPTPVNLNYLWGFGSLAGICLGIQLLSGIFLNMYYVAHPDYAFQSIEYIMREVNFGWFVRYAHANGASFFFIITYLHIGRAIYFRSYKNKNYLWYSGLILFFLMMGTAFLGYVLPWGQMSFWGAMVITKIFGSLPIIGESFELWLWGGSTVTGITLHRFLTLHYVFGFLLVGLVVVHLTLLHEVGSNRPLKLTFEVDNIPFYPTYAVKDAFVLTVMLSFFFMVVCFYSNVFGHPDNYIIANSMVTPLHIVPEWYFLPFYAALRAIENKILGIVYMLSIIISMFLLPTFDAGKTRNPKNRPFFRAIFWLWVAAWIGLGYLGAKPLVYPYTIMHKPLLVIYFLFFLGIKWSNEIENLTYKHFSKSLFFILPADFEFLNIEILFFFFIVALILIRLKDNKLFEAEIAMLVIVPKCFQMYVINSTIFNNLLAVNPGTFIIKKILAYTFIFILCLSLFLNELITRKVDFLLILVSIFLTLFIGVQANDFFVVYLVIEALAILQLSLILIYSPELKTPELTMKYFQINLIASLFLLIGIAWLYAGTLSTKFSVINEIIKNYPNVYFFLPASFIIMGLLIKIAAAPFHLWALEIYNKMPYFSLIILLGPIKIVLFFILYKILFVPFIHLMFFWQPIVCAVGLVSIIVSCTSLFFVKKIKMFFAYSSVNQSGIALLGFSTGTLNGLYSSWTYSLLYSFFLIFVFLLFIKIENTSTRLTYIDSVDKKVSSTDSLGISLGLWSLSGFPLSSGFLAKTYVGVALAGSGWLFTLIIFSFSSSLVLMAYVNFIKKVLLKWNINNNSNKYFVLFYVTVFLMGISLFPVIALLVEYF